MTPFGTVKVVFWGPLMVWVPSKELPVPAQPENDAAASIARPRAVRLYFRDVFIAGLFEGCFGMFGYSN